MVKCLPLAGLSGLHRSSMLVVGWLAVCWLLSVFAVHCLLLVVGWLCVGCCLCLLFVVCVCCCWLVGCLLVVVCVCCSLFVVVGCLFSCGGGGGDGDGDGDGDGVLVGCCSQSLPKFGLCSCVHQTLMKMSLSRGNSTEIALATG